MKRFYTRFFTVLVSLILLGTTGFSQESIMFVGRDETMGQYWGSDKDIFDSLAAWGYVTDAATNYWPNSEVESAESLVDFYGDYDAIVINESVDSKAMGVFGADNYALPIVVLEGWVVATSSDRWAWVDDDADIYQTPSAGGTADDNSIVIKDNSHYITQGYNVDDEVPWSTGVGADQAEIRPVSIKEGSEPAFSHKLAIMKSHATEADHWNLIAIDDTELPSRVVYWGVNAIGLDGGESQFLHIGTPEFYKLLKRSIEWALGAGGGSSVNELERESFSLAAFPNPAADRLILRFEAPRPGKAVATLYSITGQRVDIIEKTAVSGRNFIELRASDYPAGVYQLGLEMEGRTEYLKLVIQ